MNAFTANLDLDALSCSLKLCSLWGSILQSLFYLFRETVPTEQGRTEMQQRIQNSRELRTERKKDKTGKKEKTIPHVSYTHL